MPVATKKPKTRHRRKIERSEHRLAASQFAQDQLNAYARDLKGWRNAQTPPMHENTLAPQVGCSPQQIRNIEAGKSAPSHALSCAIFRVTGLVPISPVAAPVPSPAD